MKIQLVELSIPTRDGQFIARYSGKGLAGLNFPEVGTHRRGARSDFLRADRTPRRCVPTKILRWHRATTNALKNVLTGREPKTSRCLICPAAHRSSKMSGARCKKSPAVKHAVTVKSRGKSTNRRLFAPSAAPVAQIRFQSLSPAIACLRRMENRAASPAD